MFSVRRFLLPAVTLVFTACGGGESVTDTAAPVGPAGPSIPTPAGTVSTVQISPTALSVSAGQTEGLTVILRNATQGTLTGRAVVWESTNPTVATVSATGTVTGVSVGTVVITATSEAKVGTRLVIVGAAVDRVTLQVPSAIMTAGATQFAAATALSADSIPLADRTITWSSSASDVVRVDASTGLVTAVGPGTALITASAGGKTSNTTLTVSSRNVSAGRISAGGNNSCGITVGGQAFCWGVGGTGGSGENAVSRGPLAVAGGHTFVDISTAGRHTIALTPAGVAYGWGQNSFGELGDGANILNNYSPVRVSGAVTFRAVDVSHSRSLGLATDGRLYFWGRGYPGDSVNGLNFQTNVPLRVASPTGVRFSAISLGPDHALALSDSGVVYAWGSANSTAIGTFTTLSQTLAPRVVAGAPRFMSIVAARDISFGLTSSGQVYWWGFGGSTASTAIPQLVTGAPVFTAISGDDYNVLAVTANGSAYRWNGLSLVTSATLTSTFSALPGPPFTRMAGASQHIIGLTTTGEAWGQGSNGGGELGDGTSTSSAVFVGPKLPSFVISLAPVAVTAGTTVTRTATITRSPGGFTINGLRPFTGDIALIAASSAGITVTIAPVVVPPGTSSVSVTISAAANLAGASSFVTIDGAAPGAMQQTRGGQSFTVAAPIVGGVLDLVCTSGSSPLPAGSGYQCVTNSAGQHVPAKFSHAPMHGAWVDESAGVCLLWNSTGRMSGRYKGGPFGSAGPIAEGEWGVISRRSGAPEGTATQWYVFSETADPQLQLLGFDSTANRIIGWNFVKATACPAW